MATNNGLTFKKYGFISNNNNITLNSMYSNLDLYLQGLNPLKCLQV